ncbi:hypothetical protein HGB07_00715 [Candidatus Roizmanbacteria bacterium]|nr:hypothetical protein [Candidatus Roizmanbacteria bacterium]
MLLLIIATLAFSMYVESNRIAAIRRSMASTITYPFQIELGPEEQSLNATDSATQNTSFFSVYLGEFVSLTSLGDGALTISAAEKKAPAVWSKIGSPVYIERTSQLTFERNDTNSSGKSVYIAYRRDYPTSPAQEGTLRRKVTFYKTQAPDFARIALGNYMKEDGTVRSTTDLPDPQDKYVYLKTVAYLYAYAFTDASPVYECYSSSENKFAISTNLIDSSHCTNQGEKLIRRIGWISRSSNNTATIPLYRCLNNATRTHFVSSSRNCDGLSGASLEYLLGYAVPSYATLLDVK